MASVNAVIRVDIDASAANAGLQSMAAQMQKFNKGMVQGSSSMAAAQIAAAQRAQGALNRTGQWIASTGQMMTAAGRMHKQFDKGTMASWQQWRDTSRKNNLINEMAAQRVRALQTQYVALGKEIDGTQKVMKAQPTGMLRQWGAEAEFAHQKAVLLNRRMSMGANSMINWGKNTQWAGRQMMVGMGIPLGLAAMGAVKSYKEMETAAISFKRVYGDASTSSAEKAQMLGKIQNGVAQEMTKYGIAVADTVDVAARAAATGQQGDALVTSTRETMRLATLGQMDYSTALESTIATQTAFGVSSKGMTRVTDFLNAAENQTILSMSDMAKAIPRVAPVIKGLGGDVEDLGVLMTALRAGGVTAEQGANALKSGLASLINPTSSATEAMNSFGIPLDKIVKSNRGDLIGTVQDFGKALGKLPKFEQQQALASLFGKYQFARMGALFKNINSKQAKETARLSRESSANLAKISEAEMSQISDSAMNKFQGAIERLKAAAAPLGEEILSSLAPVVDVMSKVVGFFADNDAARNVALFGAAFAGLAGAGTMITGVFANFFGTMMKGWLGMKNLGRRALGRPSLGYQSIDDLEASAAQRQLAAAAAGATESLYAERGAVTQLAAALNAMNAELRENAGLQAAASGKGRPPGPAPKPITPRPTPSEPGGGATVVPPGPKVLPTTQRDATAVWQKTHVGDRVVLTKQQVDDMKSGGSKAVKAEMLRLGDRAVGSAGYSARTLLLPGHINNAWQKGQMVDKGTFASALHHAGVMSLEPMFKTMGLDVNDPEIQRRAQAVHEEMMKGIAAGPSKISESTAVVPLTNAMNKVFADNYGKALDRYNLAGGLNAIDTAGGRAGVPAAAGGAGLPFYKRSGTSEGFITSGAFSGIEATPGSAQAAAAALSGSAAALDGAASALSGAAAALGGKGGAADSQKKAWSTPGLTRVGQDEAAIARQNAAREATLASQRRQREMYDPNKMGAPMLYDKNKPSFWNRMRSGGAFGGGMRGMTPQEKADAKMNRTAKFGNTMMGLGMAAETVMMGLQMTGHELPAFAHAIPMAAMTLGMMPGLITEPLSALGSSLVAAGGAGVALGGLGLAAAALGANFVYHKMVTANAIKAGEKLADAQSVSSEEINALGQQYGRQSIVEKKNAQERAKAAGTTTESLAQGKQALESEVGKKILEDATKVMETSGLVDSAKSVAAKLATANLQGTMGYKDSKGFLGAMGEQNPVIAAAAQREYGKLVTSANAIKTDPVGLALKLQQTTGRAALATATKVQSQIQQAQTQYQTSGSYSSYSGMYGGGGGSGGNLAVESPALGAINSKYAGFQGTIWSNSLEQQVANREAAMIRLQAIQKQMNDEDTTAKQQKVLAEQWQNGTQQLAKFDAQAKKSWDTMQNTWASTDAAGQDTMLSSMDESARNRATDPMSKALTEMGLQKLYDFRNTGDSSGQTITKDVQFRITSALASGALNPDALSRMLDMGAEGANKIDLAIANTSSLNEAGDFFNKLSTFKPRAFSDAIKGVGNGFVKAAKYAGMTTKEATGLAKALGASQADVDKVRKAFKGGGIESSGKSKGEGDKETKDYDEGRNKAKDPKPGGGVKNSGKSGGEGNKEASDYDNGRNKAKKEVKGGGVKGDTGKASAEGGKVGDAYARAMKTKMDQVSKMNAGPKPLGLGAAASAGAKAVSSTTKKTQTVKLNFQVGKMPKVKPQSVKLNYHPGKMPKPKSQSVKLSYKPGKMPKPKSQSAKVNYNIGKQTKPKAQNSKVNYTKGSQQKPEAQNTKVNYQKGSQQKPEPQNTKVNYDLGSQAMPTPKNTTVNYTLGSQEAPSPKTATVNYVKGGSIGGPFAMFLADGGGVGRKAFSGRRVSGPGGKKDDKVAAWLSNNEFVMQSDAVDKYGLGFMHEVNALRLAKGGDGKSKDSGKSSGGSDKDNPWKDFTKELNKSGKMWHTIAKALKGGKSGKYGASGLAAALGSGEHKVLAKFLHGKAGREYSRKAKMQDKVERASSFYEQEVSDQTAIKASKIRLKGINGKKNKISAQILSQASDEELIAIKEMGLKGRALKRWAKSKKKLQRSEFNNWKNEQDAVQKGNAIRAKAAKTIGLAGMNMSDEEIKGYQSLKNKKQRSKFLRGVRKRYAANQAFEQDQNYYNRLDSLSQEKAYSNRFGDKKLKGLNAAAMDSLSSEDYQILKTKTGPALQNFIAQLNASAMANIAASQAAKKFAQQVEYMNMTQGERNQTRVSKLEEKSQTIKDMFAAKGEAELQRVLGQTRAQVEATMNALGNEVTNKQHDQELLSRQIDDINKAYDKQAKLLDDISQSQQVISSIMKGRMAVSSALSSGDIAAAAAAAQEQRAAEAQGGLDLMKAALEKERDNKIEERQNKIDAIQTQIDGINDKIFKYQKTMNRIQDKWATAGADWTKELDSQVTKAKSQSDYWKAIITDINDAIKALNRAEAAIRRSRGAAGSDNATDAGPTGPTVTQQATAAKNQARAELAELKAAKVRALKNAQRTKSKADDKKVKDLFDKAIDHAIKKKARVIELANKGKLDKAKVGIAAMDKNTGNLITKAAGIVNTQADKQKQAEKRARKKAKEAAKKKRQQKKHAYGGFVGGYGNTDKVDALLTPGEFVMTKGSAARFGKALEKVNSPSFKFAPAAGALVGGSAMGGNVYNLVVNAKTDATADDIATIAVRRIQDMERRSVRERMVR